MPKENHTGILCTKRNLPCIHPPTVTVDKKQKQVTQVLPHPSTSHCKHLHGTGVSQCLTTCSVPDRDLCCLSPSRTGILPANPGEPHAASPDSAQHGNKRGWQRNQSAWRPGAAVKPHQDSSSHGKQGFHFVPAAPTLEKLAGSEES